MLQPPAASLCADQWRCVQSAGQLSAELQNACLQLLPLTLAISRRHLQCTVTTLYLIRATISGFLSPVSPARRANCSEALLSVMASNSIKTPPRALHGTCYSHELEYCSPANIETCYMIPYDHHPAFHISTAHKYRCKTLHS